MLEWIINNIGTVMISAVLSAVAILIVIKMIKDRRNGKSNCSCGCRNCAVSSSCTKSK